MRESASKPRLQRGSQDGPQPASQPPSQPDSQPAGERIGPSSTVELDKVVNRLKRIEGQVRGLQRMVGEGAHCEDVLTQLSATRAALDRVGILLITHKVRECLLDEDDTSSEAAVQRALETFQRYAQHLQVQPDESGGRGTPGHDPS